jgi:hypothetical protein
MACQAHQDIRPGLLGNNPGILEKSRANSVFFVPS